MCTSSWNRRVYGLVQLTPFVYVFALPLGVHAQFFANRLRFDSDGFALPIGSAAWFEAVPARLSFDDFFGAMTTVFVILSNENWNAVMYDCWRATDWSAALYFVLLIMLGTFVMMNLFLAILLNNFSDLKPNNGGDDDAAVEETETDGTTKKTKTKKMEKKLRELRESISGGTLAFNTNDDEPPPTEPNLTSRKDEFGAFEGDVLLLRPPRDPLVVAKGCSLGFLSEQSPLRQSLVRLISWPVTRAVFMRLSSEGGGGRGSHQRVPRLRGMRWCAPPPPLS